MMMSRKIKWEEGEVWGINDFDRLIGLCGLKE
jgi:hypothetical protein